jgi:hypothetical protein
MKTVDAYRFGESQPPVWRVWAVRWVEVHALGEQMLHGERVNIVEKGRWNQSMRPGPATLTGELKLVRGGG